MVDVRNCASALALVLCGCAAPASQVPIVATVPVAVECPAPPKLALPQLPVASLKPDAPPDDVAKAYAASVQMLKDAVKQRELLLDAYREKPSDRSPDTNSGGEGPRSDTACESK